MNTKSNNLNILEPEILHQPSEKSTNKRAEIILVTNNGEKVAEKMWTPRDRNKLFRWPQMWLPIDLYVFNYIY